MSASLAAPQGFWGLQANFDGTVTPLDEPVVAAAKAKHLQEKFGNSYAPFYPGSYGPAYYGGLFDHSFTAPSYAPHLTTALDAVRAFPAPTFSAGPISVATAPISVAAAPISVAAAPISVSATPVRVPSTPVRVASTPVRVASTPVRVASSPVAPVMQAVPAVPERNIPLGPTPTFKITVPESSPVAVQAPAPVTTYNTGNIVDPAISDEVAAHQLARAEALGIQAGGLYAEVFGNDPNQGLVRHASGALTPAEPAVNIQARVDHYNAVRAANRS